MFPPKTAAIKQTKNGIVAKSPKGKVVLPGKITANKIVIGTKINEEDNTAGGPTYNAASLPTYNSLPGKRF